MANKVFFTGTCPKCGKPVKIYSQMETRLCRKCITTRPDVIGVEQLPLPEAK